MHEIFRSLPKSVERMCHFSVSTTLTSESSLIFIFTLYRYYTMAHPKSILHCLHKNDDVTKDRHPLSQAIMRGPEWNVGHPDETVQLDEETLLRITRGEDLILIRAAIEIKKTNLFAKVYSQVLQHNGVECQGTSEDPVPLDNAEVANALC